MMPIFRSNFEKKKFLRGKLSYKLDEHNAV